MILETNGKSFELKLSDLNVSFTLPIKNKKLGGSTSASDTINLGTKPKEISVAGIAKYEDDDNLKLLIKLAEAVNADGSRVVYIISDKTANLGDVREVIFNSDFHVKKMAKFDAWNVSFTLLQYNSIAEKKEERAAPKTSPVTDTVTGEAVGSNSTQENKPEEKKGFIFETLKAIDSFLAPDNENN